MELKILEPSICDVSDPNCGVCDGCIAKARHDLKIAKKQRRRANQKKNNSMRKKAHKKRRQVVLLYGKKCYICKIAKGDTIDHVIPISKGGTNAIENLRPACYKCNYEKGDSIDESA